MAVILLFGVFTIALLQCGEAQQKNCQCSGKLLWGTVCGRGWDFRDATVVCRQLGFAKALAATIQSSFGTGSGRIWLSDVWCRGIENQITECPRSTWGQVNGYCRQHLALPPYQGIAGVVCAGESTWSFQLFKTCTCM